MRLPGRLSAAIEILADFDARRVPLKTAIADWARNARFAGAKDRAWISGLCLDVLRRRNSLAALMEDASPRAAALAALAHEWRVPFDDLSEAAAGEHGPGALSNEEAARLKAGPRDDRQATHILGDYPEWTHSMMARAFGDDASAEGAALATRADIDLRLNTLKTAPEKALAALKSVGAEALPILTTAARIAAPDPAEKAPAVTIIPAFNKGWVEVQDLGSQLAAAAAGDLKGAQVLDFCAGGGGKTLALAALMENKGQIYAYDDDARRLAPIFERAKRAGLRNLQILSPSDLTPLDALAEKMDVAFVDAPCTGSGTWRRHPDSKWRLTPQQLERRIEEQDKVLKGAARFVKPGGRLVYVTCSVFMEENEDRLDAFIATHPQFARVSALDGVQASGILTEEGRAALEKCVTPMGDLRITPARLRADGFFISVLRRV
jgi:16S rRNA (cytosine967-C5)-methyltransferase